MHWRERLGHPGDNATEERDLKEKLSQLAETRPVIGFLASFSNYLDMQATRAMNSFFARSAQEVKHEQTIEALVEAKTYQAVIRLMEGLLSKTEKESMNNARRS